MGRKFFINCDEATTICDKSQYDEASLYDKFRLSFHLALCKYCRQYTKQNHLMTGIFNNYATPCQSSGKMPEKDKQELELKLKEEIKKQ